MFGLRGGESTGLLKSVTGTPRDLGGRWLVVLRSSLRAHRSLSLPGTSPRPSKRATPLTPYPVSFPARVPRSQYKVLLLFVVRFKMVHIRTEDVEGTRKGKSARRTEDRKDIHEFRRTLREIVPNIKRRTVHQTNYRHRGYLVLRCATVRFLPS